MFMQAQLDLAPARNQPRDVPIKLRLLTSGRLMNGRSIELLIHELSRDGLMIKADAPLTVGGTIQVELPRTGAMDLEIVSSIGSYFDCRFLQPLLPATINAVVLKSLPGATHPTETENNRAEPADFSARLTDLRLSKNWAQWIAEQSGMDEQDLLDQPPPGVAKAQHSSPQATSPIDDSPVALISPIDTTWLLPEPSGALPRRAKASEATLELALLGAVVIAFVIALLTLHFA